MNPLCRLCKTPMVQRSEMAAALDYVAGWFAAEMVANEVRLVGFNPPPEVVDRVVAEMVCQPKLGWPDEAAARFDLAERWPDCEAL